MEPDVGITSPPLWRIEWQCQPLCSQSELSLPGLKDGQEVGRLNTWRPWASASRNTHAQGSLQDLSLFFNFLQNHMSQPNRTLQALPQALWPKWGGPHE